MVILFSRSSSWATGQVVRLPAPFAPYWNGTFLEAKKLNLLLNWQSPPKLQQQGMQQKILNKLDLAWVTELTASVSQVTFQQISKEAMTEPSNIPALLCQKVRSTKRERRLWKPARPTSGARNSAQPHVLGIKDVSLLSKWETVDHVLSPCMTSSWLSPPYLRSRQTHPASYKVILNATEWSIKSYLSLLSNRQNVSPTWWSARTIFLNWVLRKLFSSNYDPCRCYQLRVS